MAPQLSFYAENADSVGHSSSAFQIQGGKASAMLYLFGSNYDDGYVPPSDLIASITQILGGISTAPGNGIIERALPLAHPLFPWLYASSLSTRGFGQPQKALGQTQMEAPPFPYYTAYANYEFHVDFTPRPYVVASNASVPLLPIQFYDKSGLVGQTVGAEWVRYTNWWYERKFESLTARQGQMRFRLANSAEPNTVAYSDMPKLFLPDSVLHIVWHQVPYRYVYSTNSYIDGLIGYINQKAFTIWQPGELLYIGYKAIPYTPPVQELDSVYTGTTGYLFSAEKWVDVELTFLRTKRKIGSAAELYNSPTPLTVGKSYWTQAGWNLLPWLGDRLYHYASAMQVTPSGNEDTDQTQWAPLFNSAEFSLLFSDPDAPNAYQLAGGLP